MIKEAVPDIKKRAASFFGYRISYFEKIFFAPDCFPELLLSLDLLNFT